MEGFGIFLLLEATRELIGLPLVIIAIIFFTLFVFWKTNARINFSCWSIFKRLVGYHWLGGEAIFGIPISVSVSFIFLFVLFGAILDTAEGVNIF